LHVFAPRRWPVSERWIERVVAALPDEVYVTIDLDGFDPSIMPATGTPEPGGLDWYRATALLRALRAPADRRLRRRRAGADGRQRRTRLPRAKLVYRLLRLRLHAPAQPRLIGRNRAGDRVAPEAP